MDYQKHRNHKWNHIKNITIVITLKNINDMGIALKGIRNNFNLTWKRAEYGYTRAKWKTDERKENVDITDTEKSA